MPDFIFDIDGTLRNFEPEPDIDPDLYGCLLRLKVKNHLYVVTGKSYSNFQIFLNELKSVSSGRGEVENLFEAVFCEDGHVCYKSNGSDCLVGNIELWQLQKVRNYIRQNVEHPPDGYFLSYPENRLMGEITVVLQEKASALSFRQYLDDFISKNNLNRLVIRNLTHNRLSIGVKGVGKKSAIDAYNLNLADSYYFCDEENDLELAKNVIDQGGKVVCPSNAIPEIKEVAYFVSEKPYSYGVVDFLSNHPKFF